jgi:hypothetical protein
MGLGRKIKKAVGSVITSIPGGSRIADITPITESSVDMANREKINIEQLKQQASLTEQERVNAAEQTRLRLLSEEDLKKQEEELKKRTTFAGSSIATDLIRRKLLG